MAECPNCHAPLKDGDWTCGKCGAPVAGAGMAAAPGAGGDYHAAYSSGAAGAPADTYGASPAWERRRPDAGGDSAGERRLLRPAQDGPHHRRRRGPRHRRGVVLRAPRTGDVGRRVPRHLDGDHAEGHRHRRHHQEGRRLHRRHQRQPGGPEGDRPRTPRRHRAGHHPGRLLAHRRRGQRRAVQGDPQGARRGLQARLQQRGRDAPGLRIVGKSPSGQDIDETIPLVKDTTGTT